MSSSLHNRLMGKEKKNCTREKKNPTLTTKSPNAGFGLYFVRLTHTHTKILPVVVEGEKEKYLSIRIRGRLVECVQRASARKRERGRGKDRDQRKNIINETDVVGT